MRDAPVLWYNKKNFGLKTEKQLQPEMTLLHFFYGQGKRFRMGKIIGKELVRECT